MATRGWEGVTETDLARRRTRAALPTAPKAGSKYRNVKVTIGGETFDSKREAGRWLHLKARLAAGEIRALRRQVSYPLCCPTRDPAVSLIVSEYLADFDYIDVATGAHVIEDAKGCRTRLYMLKRKWLELQTGQVIVEV